MEDQGVTLRPNGHPSRARTITKSGIIAVLFLVLVFFPAGTLDWPEAWLFLFFFFSVVTALFIWMKKNSPGLLEERRSTEKDAEGWDRIIMSIYTIFLVATLALVGLDAVRFGWSKLPLTVKVLGFLGYVPATGIVFWAMKENPYLSDVVRIQEDRGHAVCTTGPYQYVRHPMYIGVIIFVLSLPASLGSLYSYVPASIIVVLFITRAYLEDKTLRQELPGYEKYAQKVRYRLLPGLW